MNELPLSEIAVKLGTPARTIRKHTLMDGFPDPVGKRGGTRLYDLEAVQAWEEQRENPSLPTSEDDSVRLVSLQEAAEDLGLSYGSMRNYVGWHESFPKPVKRISNRPYFNLEEIRTWNARRQRVLQIDADTETTEVDGLLTRTGVALELGVKPNSVTKYALRDTEFSKDFPEPARKIGRTRLWDRDEIRAWRSTRPRPAQRA
ncbi:hypothetical protein [Brachybacterium kimchii]|uniref:Transcriptional regulator n=1 Tax=Brachybacterium kimchii TaxID=2942909 RepID=A0ABY4NCA2_9MICO|nr:hypothetical protein [Brachybacterium kimchii]UQN31801.1 hypothetical protein M4486_19620 [Brachybacterium kimchii]